ncbi:MAG: YqhG family protein [Bacillota bacterium]|nr:YqhG family protein [Bacillota bacterium]MDP4169913.1 YqhG family protein [Bacillota bacterium]
MQQQEIHKFLQRFFLANECMIIENQTGYLTVQLTIDMDKELMNRPFYWHYLEKTGGIANPMKLTFITDQKLCPENIKGEAIYFGSPRLHQIFESAKRLAGFIRLYENHNPINKQTPLLPWLCMNIKISYQCDRKRDIFKSVGLQLVNGQLAENFHEKLLRISLTPKIPDFSFTLSPLIKPKSGIARVENYLRTSLEGENHCWAEEAQNRWEKDLQLLNHFYENETGVSESYENEKKALQEQYEPKIKMSIINGGIFYLTEKAI